MLFRTAASALILSFQLMYPHTPYNAITWARDTQFGTTQKQPRNRLKVKSIIVTEPDGRTYEVR